MGRISYWEEVKNLRLGQEKLWEEVKELREGQNKLWLGQEKLWENTNKLWEEVKSLREGQNRLWEEVRQLRLDYNRLTINFENFRDYVSRAFIELKSALGVTFEMQAAAYIKLLLEKMGYPEAIVGKKYLFYQGEPLKINIFCEEPLIVGEVTITVKDEDEALSEVEKLLRRVEATRTLYGREPLLKVLSVANAVPAVANKLREETGKYGIKFILGREIIEA
jgi:predicted nuclease with TOPRIM domain